jgi:hypothetical protein
MMGMRRSLWLPWVLVMVAGCPDDSGGGSAVGPVPEAEAPETAVSVICGAFTSCDCDPANKAPEGCDAQIDDQMRQALGDATAAGLEYDAACMGELLSTVRELGCRDITDFTFDELVALVSEYDCKVFNGTAQPGEACESVEGLGDSCAVGVECVAELCVAIPEPAAEGEDCEFDSDFFTACEVGTVCLDLDGDGQQQPLCVVLPDAGDACLGAAQYCNTGLACVDGTCDLAPGDGEACNIEGGALCGEGLECNFETIVCQPLPVGGEACTGSCAEGFECGNDDRCVALEPLVCDVQIYDPQGA